MDENSVTKVALTNPEAGCEVFATINIQQCGTSPCNVQITERRAFEQLTPF
jgi:hypothetical protein